MFAVILMMGVSVAMAQKDVKAIGLNLIYGSEIKNIGIGAKFQYGLTDAFRVEPSLNYYLKKDGFTQYDINVNAHYLIDAGEGLKVYPLVGVGLMTWKNEWIGIEVPVSKELGYIPSRSGHDIKMDVSLKSTELIINVGVGAEYEINEMVSVGAELKYQIIDNFNQLVFGIGATYRF